MAAPPRRNRFATDEEGRAPNVMAGYQSAVSPRIDKAMIRRNLADYGIRMKDVQGLSDQQKYDLAARKVLAKRKPGLVKRRTTKRSR